MAEEKNERAYRMDKLDWVVGKCFTVLTWFSIVSVVIIMLITVVNVITRGLFRYPIFGSVDVSSVLLSLVAMCALPIVTMFNTHIKVDLVADRLPKKAQDGLLVFNLLICTGIMVIMSIATFGKADRVRSLGTTTGSLAIPYYPVYYLIAIMAFATAICALYNVFHFLYCGNTIDPLTFTELKKRMPKMKGKVQNDT